MLTNLVTPLTGVAGPALSTPPTRYHVLGSNPAEAASGREIPSPSPQRSAGAREIPQPIGRVQFRFRRTDLAAAESVESVNGSASIAVVSKTIATRFVGIARARARAGIGDREPAKQPASTEVTRLFLAVIFTQGIFGRLALLLPWEILPSS